MQERAYQLCTRCVMDTSDPFIRFDEEGYCNHCTDYLANRIAVIRQGSEDDPQVAALFDAVRARGAGRKYDCVIGISGGVDSSYTCALAAKHGLRILGVHLDNGWNSPAAVENIRTLASKFGMGYASYVLPWTDFRKVQLAFLKGSVPEAETPTDVAIQRALHHHAVKNDVKTILSGGNMSGEGILPVSWHYNARDTRYSHAILDHAGVSRRHFASQRFGAVDEIIDKVIRRIRTIYPLNLFSYDKEKARRDLEAAYGWKYYGSKHGESRYTRFIQTYYLFVKHGIDYRRATFSSEIILGRVDRQAALQQLKTLPYDSATIDDEIDYVCKKLDLSRVEMNAIIAAPPRYYTDYPNNAAKLGLMYNAYRRLTGRAKTSNF